MKMEWLVTDVTPVESPHSPECAILGVIFAGFFFVDEATFVVGEPLCDVRTPSLEP